MSGCPEATMECIYCKDKNIKAVQFPEHMGQKHQQECSRLLLEFHRQKDEVKVIGPQNKTISPFALGPRKICKNGRIVCGGDLGLPANNNPGLFKNSIKALCSL